MADEDSLTPYWITPCDPHGPFGLGVTAWNLEDAISLLREAGFVIDPSTAKVTENVRPDLVEHGDMVAKLAGPVTFRGVWHPCRNIGWGASGQH